jgi:hypothetical protein
MSMTRVLLVAHDAVDGAAIADEHAEVLVVAPAMSSRLDYWSGDDRRARRDAEQRLADSLSALSRSGHAVDGIVGDADPLLAIEDSLRLIDADVIVIATDPERRPNWLERKIVTRARRRFARPVLHVPAA